MNTQQAASLLLTAHRNVALRVAASRDNTPVHRAADAHYKPMLLAVQAAFNVGRKSIDKAALKAATTAQQARGATDGAAPAVRAALLKMLPTVLGACLKAGADAGLLTLGKRLRAAGDVEGHEFHGNQWTEGGAGSSFVAPENFKLKDAQYDVNTKLPLTSMVVASVDVGLLSSTYKNDWRVREMTASLKQSAKFPPVTLEQKKDGSLSILDGNTRIAALREAGIKGKVLAVIRLYDEGTESRLPKGAVIDHKRTASLRAASLRTLKPQVPGQPHDRKPPFDLAFNVSDPRAVEWAKAHAAELAKGLSDTTREDIANTIATALEDGDLDSAYDDILAAVGDEARAELIARNEIMTAANEGNRQGWDQAVEDGLLPDDTRVVWIATSGACDICQDLDGETRPIDGEYENEDGADGPPQHVSCRCTEGIAS